MQEGFLEKDPRSTGFHWRELLAPVVGDLRLESDVSQVAEVGACLLACPLCRFSRRRAPSLYSSEPWHLQEGPDIACLTLFLVTSYLPNDVQLLNVAWARHELVGDTTDLSLRWLEAGGKKSPEELGI
jgi:hypothetical protein